MSNEIKTSVIRGSILKVLFTKSSQYLTTKEVIEGFKNVKNHATKKVMPTNVSTCLNGLVQNGLVNKSKSGPSYIYQINSFGSQHFQEEYARNPEYTDLLGP